MFNIEIEFQKGNTYYIRIRGAINCTGSFRFLFKAYQDDYSNHSAYAYNLGDVYNNKSIDGSLSTGQNEDVDYFCFHSSKNALFEIYTEGNVRAIGRLFYENGLFLTNNYGGGEGDNFKISYYIEAGKTYYLAVEQADCEYALTDYTLKFKFICDWDNAINEQYQYKMWLNDDQTSNPHTPIGIGNPWEDYYVFRSIEFISERAKHEYEIRVLEDRYSQKSALEAAIDSGVLEDIAQALFGFGLGLLPGFGALSLTYEISNLVLHTIAETIRSSYEQATIDINATNNYITNTNAIRWSIGYDHYLVYVTITRTNIESSEPVEIYLGRDFSRGKFIALCMKDDSKDSDSRCKKCGICDNYIEYQYPK